MMQDFGITNREPFKSTVNYDGFILTRKKVNVK